MANTYRNRPLIVWNLFFSHFRGLKNQSADGRLPFRDVVEGEIAPDNHVIPVVALKLTVLKPIGIADGDKQKQGKIKIKIISTVPSVNDATAEILSKISQVDNHLENFTKPDGTSGFELADWGTTYSMTAEHGNIISAECELTFSVVVSRGGN